MEQQTLEEISSQTDDTEEAAAVAGKHNPEADAIIDPAEERYPESTGRVEIDVVQVDYTLRNDRNGERPILHIFGRTTDNTIEHIRVHEFQPYFYAPTENLSDDDLDRDVITGWEHGYESIRGKELTKIYGQTPRDVGNIRDEFDHYEADILFPNRLLIDKDIKSGVRVPERRNDDGVIDIPHTEIETTDISSELRVNVFDIEVDDRSGFPEDGEEPIISISSYDSFQNEYIAWLFDAPETDVPPPQELENYELLKTDSSAAVDVRVYETEETMLDDFISYLERTNPDILTGWNFTDFDAPYLLDRLEILDNNSDYNLDIDRLSRVNEVWRSGWQGPNIKGRVVFDLLNAYQRTQFSELESYRLDAVAEQELNVGKETYTGDIGDLWETDPERLLEYNLRDVELCVEIDRKQDIIPFWKEVANFVGCKIEDAPTPGDAVDMYVLHNAHGKFVLPSKGGVESGEEFEGGAVFDPITGVRDNVSVLDLKCFSGDTEILTPEGSKNIKNVDEGDPIYTLNPETFECEVSSVTETHAYANRYGNLHHLRGKGYDVKVTENHRFLLSEQQDVDKSSPDNFEFSEFREISADKSFQFPDHEPIDGETPETFDLVEKIPDGTIVAYFEDTVNEFHNRMPESVIKALDQPAESSEKMGAQKSKGKYLIPLDIYKRHRGIIDKHADDVFLHQNTHNRKMPISFQMTDWLEFIGYYVAEGEINEAQNSITIHQNDRINPEAIYELLDQMEVNYNNDGDAIHISNQFLGNWLEENCGSEHNDKRLPEMVFDLDGELTKILLATLIRDDESWADSEFGEFRTTHTDLKDDVLDLAIRSGYKPTVSKQAEGIWKVSINKGGTFQKATNATVENHDGQVYCITTTDNHIVLAGRNGHFQWIGQSLYPMSMVTINASPETKVDPDEYDDETYVAPNGTHFQKTPEGIIREMVTELLAEREEKKEKRDQYDPDTDAYDRYDRQQESVKVIMNCFTSDTEVVTPTGIKNIRDLAVGDRVYSLDPQSMEVEVKPVTRTYAYPNYTGDLVRIQTDDIDFQVTPNHRMFIRNSSDTGSKPSDWHFQEAGTLKPNITYEVPSTWQRNHSDSLGTNIDINTIAEPLVSDQQIADGGQSVPISSPGENVPNRIPASDLLTLLALYIRAGATKPAHSPCSVVFDIEDPDEKQTLHRIVNDQLKYNPDTESGLKFSSSWWAQFLEYLCGSKETQLKIPDIVFQGSRKQKQNFLQTLAQEEGDVRQNFWQYKTQSKALRDDLLKLCTELGIKADYESISNGWQIVAKANQRFTFEMDRDGDRCNTDDGVYCVEIADNNTLLAGRNGTFQFVGNSLYGVSGWERFRLYDKEAAAAVTATGREVIKFTETAVNEQGKEVIYGDTDSVMLSLGDDLDKQSAIDQSFTLEDHINDRYDEFALNELNAESHRFEIEFEKLYRRFFQAGKKKRYAGHIVWKEGKDVDDIDITGFEYKRSDIAQITKEVQRNVIEMIVTGEDRENIKEYIHDVIENFKAGQVSLDEIAIPGGIGKRLDNYETDTAHVRGAKYANLLLGTNFNRGSKPKRLYLEKVHPSYFREIEENSEEIQNDPLYTEFKRNPDVICFEYEEEIPEEFTIDYEKMLDKTLKGPISRVLEAIDISWEEVKSGQTQTGLGKFSS